MKRDSECAAIVQQQQPFSSRHNAVSATATAITTRARARIRTRSARQNSASIFVAAGWCVVLTLVVAATAAAVHATAAGGSSSYGSGSSSSSSRKRSFRMPVRSFTGRGRCEAFLSTQQLVPSCRQQQRDGSLGETIPRARTCWHLDSTNHKVTRKSLQLMLLSSRPAFRGNDDTATLTRIHFTENDSEIDTDLLKAKTTTVSADKNSSVDNATTAADSKDSNEDSSKRVVYSKAKWKKKRFLMMKDVQDAIQRGDPRAPNKAEEMIRRMNKLQQVQDGKEQESSSAAETATATATTDAVVQSAVAVVGGDAEGSVHVSFAPDTQAYNLWLKALAKTGDGAAAEGILREMWKVSTAKPNVISYSTVMDAYAQQSKVEQQQQQQQQYRKSLLSSTLDFNDNGMFKNHINYNYNNNDNSLVSAAEHAERLLFEMLDLIEQRETTWKITSIPLDTVLNAWAQQGTTRGASRAQEILERLERMSGSGGSKSSSTHLRPTAHSYTTVIHGWATAAAFASKRGIVSEASAAATKAQAILNQMVQKAKEHAQDAKKEHVAGGGSSGSSSNKADAAVLVPDTMAFNAVIHAWAASGDPQAGTKAVQLLQQMKEFPETCQPDIVTYNSILSAWSHCGHINAAPQAEKILQQMITNQGIAPNVVSYNTVLHAWSKSPLEGAARRAETLLQYMIQSSTSSSSASAVKSAVNTTSANPIAPDVYSFSTVLDALAKSKEPDKAVRARALLDQMLARYQFVTDAEKSTEEDSTTSTTTKASKRSKKQDQWGASDQVSQIPFNTVLNAAAFSAMGTTLDQQKEALQVAVSTFALMRKVNIPPDEVSYGNLMKAFANLIPTTSTASRTTRFNMALQLFDKCREAGYVNELVWNEVRRAVVPIEGLSNMLPAKLLSRFITTHGDPSTAEAEAIRSMQLKDLPRAWRRNTRGAGGGRASPSSTAKPGVSTSNKQQQDTTANDKAPIRKFLSISETSYQSGRDV